MLDKNTQAFLQTALNNELKLCSQLFELMATEQRCYETQELDPLDDILKQKAGCLDAIENSVSSRFSVFGIKLLSPNHQALFEQQINNYAPLMNLWEQVKTAMFRCKTQNEINGQIIKLSQKSVERSLNIFKQSLRPNNLTTYSSNGKASQTPINISSAKA